MSHETWDDLGVIPMPDHPGRPIPDRSEEEGGRARQPGQLPPVSLSADDEAVDCEGLVRPPRSDGGALGPLITATPPCSVHSNTVVIDRRAYPLRRVIALEDIPRLQNDLRVDSR